MIKYFVIDTKELDRINEELESRGVNAGDVISIVHNLDDESDQSYLVFYCSLESTK